MTNKKIDSVHKQQSDGPKGPSDEIGAIQQASRDSLSLQSDKRFASFEETDKRVEEATAKRDGLPTKMVVQEKPPESVLHPYVYVEGTPKNPVSSDLFKTLTSPNNLDLIPKLNPVRDTMPDPKRNDGKTIAGLSETIGSGDTVENSRTTTGLNVASGKSASGGEPGGDFSVKSDGDKRRFSSVDLGSATPVRTKEEGPVNQVTQASPSSRALANLSVSDSQFTADEGLTPRNATSEASKKSKISSGEPSVNTNELEPKQQFDLALMSGESNLQKSMTAIGNDGKLQVSVKRPEQEVNRSELLAQGANVTEATPRPNPNYEELTPTRSTGSKAELSLKDQDLGHLMRSAGERSVSLADNPQGKTDTPQVPAGKIPHISAPGTVEGTKSDGGKQPGRVPLSTAADALPPATGTEGKRNEVQSPAVRPGVTGGAKADVPTSKIQTGATKPNAPGNKDDAGNPPGKPTGDARTIKGQTPSSTGSAEFDPRQGKPRAVKQTDGRQPGAEKPPKSPSSIEPPAKVPGARTNATDIGQTRITSGKTDGKQPAAESSVKTVSGIKSGGGQSDASTPVGQKSRGDEGKRGLIDGQKAQVNDGGVRGVINGQKPQGMEGGGRVSSDGQKSQATDGGKRGLVNAEHQPAVKFGPLDAAPVGIRRGLAGTKPANSPTEVKAEKGFVSNGLRGNSEAGAGGKRGSGLGPGGAKRADGGINQEVKQGSARIGDASSGRRPQMEGARIDAGNVRADGQTGRAARAEAVSGHSNSGRAHGVDSPKTEAKIDPGKVGSALGDIIKTNVTGVKYGANESVKGGTGEGLKGGAASSKGSGARETVDSGKSESAEGGKAPSPKGDKAQSLKGDKAQSPTGAKAQSPKSDPADFVKNPATESVRQGLVNAGKQGQRVPPERTVVGGVVDASTPKTPGEGSTRRVSADGTTKKGPAEVPSKKGPFELAPGSLEPKPNLTERPKPPAALPQAENPHGIVRGDKFTAKPLSPAKQPLEPGKPLATKGDGRGFEVPLRGVRNALGDLGQKLIEKISRTLGEVKADAAKSQTVKLVYGLELARVLTAALKAGAQRADVLGGNPQPQRGPAGDAPQRRAVGDGARERRPLIDASSRAEMQLNAANTLTVTRLVPKGVREIPVSDRAIDKIKLTSRLETPTVRATALHRLETAAINAKTVPVVDRAHRAVEIRTQAPPTEARLQNPLETRATPAIEAHTVRVEQSEFRPMTARPDTADGATKGFNRLQPQVNEQASEKPKAKDARPRRREGEPEDGRHKGETPRHIRDVFLKFNISIPKRSFHPAITDSGSYVALDDVSSQRLNTFISSGTHKALKSETEFERRSNRSGWLADATADQETSKTDGGENNAAATAQAANVKSQDEKQLAKNVQAGTAGDTARKVYIVQSGDTAESIALVQLHDQRLVALVESINEMIMQRVYDVQKNAHVKILPVGAMILLPNSRDISAFREQYQV
ncbi:hypothetical protein KF913_18350 [Candidatus Obscuribacterales bacterium]|nr:hypothetical protein [Candidatus Obscuribacterales bacterium]